MRVELGGNVYCALVDTNLIPFLIGEWVCEDRRRRSLHVRKVTTALHLMDGKAEVRGAVRLHLSLDGRRRKPRFVYLPEMQVLIILGPDFACREGIILDITNNGYHYSPLTPLISFVGPPSLGQRIECSIDEPRQNHALAA